MNVEVRTVVFIEEWRVGSGELRLALLGFAEGLARQDRERGAGSGERENRSKRAKREHSSTINSQPSTINYQLLIIN